MNKKFSLKLSISFISIIALLVAAFILKTVILKPRPINKIEFDKVYTCGLYGDYPKNDESRYYITLKKDKTFVLIEDESRGKEEDYLEDGDYNYPNIDISFGKYEIKDGNYVLTTTQGSRVKFKNTAGVKKKMINFYWQGALIGDDANEKMVIFITPESQFVLGYPNKNSKTYNKHRRFCTLYNKSDIKKLPDSPDEFRKQFKMDKKAEKERVEREKNFGIS